MREIKFRAWDGEQFHYGKMGAFGLQWNRDECILPHGRVYVFEQFTGLQDASDVDIYEGDIVQWSYEDSGGRSFIGLVVAGPSFEIIIDDWGVTHYSNGFAIQFLDGSGYKSFDGHPLTVIGNIHEHPHLLEE